MKRFVWAVLLACLALTANAQEGAWTGEIEVQGVKLPLVFNFDSEGCSLDSPSQGAKGIKAEKELLDGGRIRIKVPMAAADFEGTMEGSSIKGTFTQNGMSFPMTLLPGKPKVNRPQTPVAPFPYTTEEVAFANGDFALSGTLTMPKDCNDNTKVVLMVTGSGQQNRDEEIFEHKPFAVIADALAREGIASLRYDDRGYGDSTVVFSNFTTDDFKKDAEAGLDFLRKRFKKVAVLGHSEGGTIALMLAAEGKADFVVSMAGMCISGKETLLMQNRQGMAPLGLPKETVDAYCNAMSDAFDKLAEGKSVKDVDRKDVPVLLRSLFEMLMKQVDVPFMRRMLTLDIRKDLPKVTCPVLALNGKKDMQVDCVRNISALQHGLMNCKPTIVSLDDLNHLFQHCKTGNVVEYQQIEETISVEVLKMITEWLKEVEN
ncbi:MAG: alpha/beta hydrolase [Prevotella sp.]